MATEIVTKNYPMLRKIGVAESDALVISCVYNPLLQTRELTRYFPNVQDGLTEQATKLLMDYTSAKNENKQFFVLDPSASNQVYPGTWRGVTVRSSEKFEPPGLVQILREGFATELSEDEARLGVFQGDASDATYTFGRYWPNIRDTHVVSLAAALTATKTVTNPKIQKTTQSGTYASSGIQGNIVEGDGSGIVSQTLAKITSITAVADLAALTPRLVQGNEILDLFGLETGEADYFAFTYRGLNPSSRLACLGISDADLVSNMANKDAVAWVTTTAYTVGYIATQGGTTYVCLVAHTSGTFSTDLAAGKWASITAWQYNKRDFKEMEDNTAHFSILFLRRTWNAWWHGSYAADNFAYDNAGTANEKEQLTKTWEGIRIADLATARDNCRTGTSATPEAGYIITSVTLQNRNDGAINVIQVQKKQVTNVDVGTSTTPGIDMINPLGWDGGTISVIETHYESFTAAGLATAISGESAPSGYTLDTRKPSLAGDGLHNLIYRYIKATFLNFSGTGTDKVLLNTRTFAYGNTDPDNGKYGIRASKVDGGDGIPIADLPTIRDNQVAASGWAITDVTANDNKDGSGSVRRSQILKRGTGDFFIIGYTPQQGNQEESQTVVWHDLSETNADLIKADAQTKAATMASATYAAAPAGHVLQAVRKNPTQGVDSAGAQLFDVVRSTFIPIWNYSTVGLKFDREGEIIWSHDEIEGYNSAGSPTKFDRVTWRNTYSTAADAWTYANDSTDNYYTELGVLLQLGKVEYHGKDRTGADVWVGFKVILT